VQSFLERCVNHNCLRFVKGTIYNIYNLPSVSQAAVRCDNVTLGAEVEDEEVEEAGNQRF